MSNQFPRRRWAESGDWDSVRPLITRMYKVEGRPLKEVMRIMETEHQFLATPKMYKKRIKDWAIDKNLRSEKAPGSPRTKHQRDATPSQSQSSVSNAEDDGQRLSSYARSSPGPVQDFLYGTRPSAQGATQSGYHTPATTLPPQQPSDGQSWIGAGQFRGDSPYTSFQTQGGQAGEQSRSSILLGSIRDRFLEASDAITRQDTAVLFEILNPAYEAISSVSETETSQLLAVVVDLFQLLSRRPNHQDMLKQLLQYVFALFPDAARQNHFLSTNRQVLTLLGRQGHASSSGVPLDTAGGRDSKSPVPPHTYGYSEQPSGSSGAGPTWGNRSGGYCMSFY